MYDVHFRESFKKGNRPVPLFSLHTKMWPQVCSCATFQILDPQMHLYHVGIYRMCTSVFFPQNYIPLETILELPLCM